MRNTYYTYQRVVHDKRIHLLFIYVWTANLGKGHVYSRRMSTHCLYWCWCYAIIIHLVTSYLIYPLEHRLFYQLGEKALGSLEVVESALHVNSSLMSDAFLRLACSMLQNFLCYIFLTYNERNPLKQKISCIDIFLFIYIIGAISAPFLIFLHWGHIFFVSQVMTFSAILTPTLQWSSLHCQLYP